jgi:hypothetical protein
MSPSAKEQELAAFITSRDTLDGAYPGLVLEINAARLGDDDRHDGLYPGRLHRRRYDTGGRGIHEIRKRM